MVIAQTAATQVTPRITGVSAPVRATEGLAPKVTGLVVGNQRAPRETVGAVNDPSTEVVVIEESATAPTMPLRQEDQLREISAVILDVSAESVALACRPNGAAQSVRIMLPRDLIPDGLARYGTPVTVGLDTTGSFRHPVVKPRHYVRATERTAEEIEIDEWIASLR